MSQAVTTEHKIRMLAYGIWLGEGCPHGRDLDHWLAAERRLMSMSPEIVTGENQNAPTELAKSRDSEIAIANRKQDATEHAAAVRGAKSAATLGSSTDNIVERQKARVKAAAGRVFERSEFLALSTVQAYLEVLRQGELARLSRDNVTAHQSTLNDVLSRVRAGSSSSADLSQAENRLTVAQSDYVEAQRRVEDANTTYLRLVRLAPTGLVRPATPTDALPQSEDDAVRRALKANPSVTVADLDREAAVADSRAAEASFLPRLDFEVVGSKGHNVGGVDGQNDDLTIMLVARWNLFSGGSDSARVAASRERIMEAQERTNRFKLVSEEEVRKSWTAMVRQREQTAKLVERVRAAENVYTAYRQQFDIGRRDILDVLNAQNDLYNARSAVLSADYSAQFAAYRILAVCGDLLNAMKIAAPKEADGTLR